jgi:hypothetical protein
VAIDVINNDGRGTDSATMQVFGTGDSLLTTIDSSAIGFPGHQTLSFKSGSANISYIRLTSANGSDFNLDYLQFSNQISVPAHESGSLALIGFGLLVYFSRQERQGNPA